MRLSVTCPRCQSKYQLDAAMRGKRMRCPNSICREVFEARDDAEPPPVQAQEAPRVQAPADFPGDEEPAVPGPPPVQAKAIARPPEEAVADFPGDDEPAVPAPPPPPVEARKPEPVVKPVQAKKAESLKRKPVPRPIEPEPLADFADDFPGDGEAFETISEPAPAVEAWQPQANAMPPSPPAAEIGKPVAAIDKPPRRKRLALWASVGLLAALVGIGVGSWWRIGRSIASNEDERFQAAQKLYDRREFAEASAALQKLYRDFPDSASNKKYRFLAELSDVREAVYGPHESSDELGKALQRVLQLAGVYKGDPLLDKERQADLWLTLDDLARQLTRSAEVDKSPAQLALARRAWTETKRFAAPANLAGSERERKLEADWARIDRELASHQEREHVIATIKNQMENATAAGVQEAWTLAEKTNRQDDPAIRALLSELFKAHREQVRFLAEEPSAEKPPRAEDGLASLSVTPSVKRERPVAAKKPLILALARGVLYALEPANGELRWARRVGVDTHVLPVRVPADAITPEILLVMSSDQRSLSAVVADSGETFWQTPLSEACLATPLLIDGRALIPTVGGRIDEIELAEGRRLGAYQVGQPLTLGGVRPPGSPLAYFAADDFCIYEIDLKKRICTNILYTRHAPGSLRGPPILGHGGKRDLMLLCQQSAAGQAQIKPYALPIEQLEQKPLGPGIKVAGLSAPPWHDADRLAVMSEAGALSLWGYRQKGTRDPLLFPFLGRDFPVETSQRAGRCQVVHADAENVWTLVQGRLQRVEAGFDPLKGPDLMPRWPEPIALGNVVHAVQTLREPDGRTILFATSQVEDRPICLCTAIDADAGNILWQRQLGALPRRPPQLLGERILFADALGLLAFDPPGDSSATGWRPAGVRLIQDAPGETAAALLTAEDAYVWLSWPAGGTKLHVQIGKKSSGEKIRTLNIALPAAPSGEPALAEGALVMPLQNGVLVRIDLKDGALANGPDWRAAGAEEQAEGRVVALSASEFAVTDGSRGVARFACPDGRSWEKRAALELSHRIVSAPVLIADAGKSRLIVADASPALSLLDADRLTVLKRWAMPGKITAGPFIRAGKIGCIAGKSRLVWLDPNQDAPLWEYSVPDIVGEPALIDGVLVIADAGGQFRALDPSSGRPAGTVLTLKASVAASASPLPFGNGQAFVPLTDGTAIILPLQKLR